jgi:hypothetical protein
VIRAINAGNLDVNSTAPRNLASPKGQVSRLIIVPVMLAIVLSEIPVTEPDGLPVHFTDVAEGIHEFIHGRAVFRPRIEVPKRISLLP